MQGLFTSFSDAESNILTSQSGFGMIYIVTNKFLYYKGNKIMNYILIHGLGQNPASWDKVIENLPNDMPIYRPCLSTIVKGQKMTYENLYQAFEGTCNYLSEPLYLCGISLGAVLALHYAIKNPYRVKSLILIAPQYKMPRLLLTIQNIIFCFFPEKLFLETGLSKRKMISLTNSMKRLDFTPQLKKITCPALILCGERDRVNKKAAKMLAKNMIETQLLFINKAGHEVNVDVPVQLAEFIKKFWFK